MHDAPAPRPATEPTNAPSSRRRLLSMGLITGVCAVGGLTRPAQAFRGPSKRLQSLDRVLRDIRNHENDHVTYLLGILGDNARPRPTFRNLRQGNAEQFLRVAQVLENTGVGAYLGALGAISSPAVQAGAASIALIEARHAGVLNTAVGARVTTQPVLGLRNISFDRPLTPEQVGEAAAPFVASLNGGPPLTFTAGNDTSVLNYALALEYLEADFYQVNVERFL